MAIILKNSRPAILVEGSQLGAISANSKWIPLFENSADVLGNAIRAVGRIEAVDDPSLPYLGTAFLVADDLVLTTRHVASVFVEGAGDTDLRLRENYRVQVDFLGEANSSRSLNRRVTKAVFLHPYFDIAALKIDAPVDGVSPLQLLAGYPCPGIERNIAVIGFASSDPRNDLELVNQLLEGVIDVKRVMAGRTVGTDRVSSFGNKTPTLLHDASTLSGTSGAPLLDLESGHVIGIQFAGRFLAANYAVPSWELARDDRVRSYGVAFSNSGENDWMSLWDQIPVPATSDSTQISVQTLEVESDDAFSNQFLPMQMSSKSSRFCKGWIFVQMMALKHCFAECRLNLSAHWIY